MMQRIMIAVDLENNEVLETAVKEAVTGAAKQIAREEFNKILKGEIERVVTDRVKNMERWHKTKLEKIIEDEIEGYVKKAVGEIDIPRYQITKRLDEIFQSIDQKVDYLVANRVNSEKIEHYAKEQIEKEVKGKVPEVLLSLVLNALQREGQK